jgi:hypothetical protein
MPKTFRNTGCSLDVAQTQKHLLYKQRLDIRLFIDGRGRLCTRKLKRKSYDFKLVQIGTIHNCFYLYTCIIKFIQRQFFVNWDCIASNERVLSELWIEKYVERSRHGLILR